MDGDAASVAPGMHTILKGDIMNKPSVLLLALLFCGSILPGQSFIRITDPTNPVVTDQFESGGGSWIDVNKDGWPDLFVSNGNLTSQNNSLYLNLRNGNFRKIVTGAIVNDGGSSIGSTWGDYDNDGNLDVFVTNRNNFGNFLYRGTGDTVFTKITTGSVVTDIANSNSSSWVDVSNDGNLDLYVVNFSGNDFLYLNNGSPNYTFTKIDTGIVVDNSFSIVGAWADYNNDRSPDLFVGNSGTDNDFLYRSTGSGSFAKIVIPDGRATLGASWGDYDNDGFLDLFVANYLNQNNILYHNSGPPNFTLTRIDTGIVSNDGGNSVGSSWGDIDNDGDLDLFVANDGGNNALYVNNGPPDYRFTKVTSGSIVNDGGNSFGCVWGDYNRDGQLDMFVANRLNQQNFLYMNSGNSNAWISIRCVGSLSNKTAIGTKVRLKATVNGIASWQVQEVLAQSGYNSQNLDLHFGLGNATDIDSIRVDWPAGGTSVFTSVTPNRFITITENGGIASVGTHAATVADGFRLIGNYPNPFNPSTSIKFNVPRSGFVSLIVYDVLGKEVSALLNDNIDSGEHTVSFDGGLYPSGVYFYRLTSGERSLTRTMMLLK